MKVSCVYLLIVMAVMGCVSINSKNVEDRMSALADLKTQEALFSAVQNTNYEDVRVAAVSRIVEQHALAVIVESPRFSDEVKCIALSSITNQEYLADVVISDTSSAKYALAAVQGVSSPVLLCKCAVNTRFEKVAFFCVEKLTDENLLKQIVLDGRASMKCRERCLAKIKQETVLCDIVLSCVDDWICKSVVPRISTSITACRLIVVPYVPDELKLMLADRITDEHFLVECVKNQGYSDSIRRKCLEKIKDENSYVSLLKHSSVLEDWVITYSLYNVVESDILVYAALKMDFSESNRLLACARLKSPSEFTRIFENSSDDLPIRWALNKISSEYISSKHGQIALVRNFRIAKDNLLKNSLLGLMSDVTLMGLYKKSDQVMIAKAIAASFSSDVLEKAGKALFDDGVILDLALGKFSEDDKITGWSLDLNPSDEVVAEVALKSKSLSTQCRALARISNEIQVARIALYDKKRALRIAAIAKLSKKSEAALNELAQDSDSVVRMAAIKRLKAIGGGKVVEFERRAELDRRKKAAQEKQLADEQKARDEREQREFEHRYLSVAGEIQLSIIKKYLELNGKVHIESPVFQVTGRVMEFLGRKLVLKMYCEGKDVQIAVEMSQKSKDVFSKNEIVTITGYNDESTNDNIRLRCGELIKRGVGLK